MWKFLLKPIDRLKSNFWGVLIFCIMLLFAKIFGTDTITIAVKPNNIFLQDTSAVFSFGGNKVLPGRLFIQQPTFTQKILLRDEFNEFDCLTLIGIATCSILILVLLPKLKEEIFFRKDLTKILYAISILLIVYAVLSDLRMFYENSEIKRITENRFMTLSTFPVGYWLLIYLAFVIIRSIKVYKRGIQLQQDQDLTV